MISTLSHKLNTLNGRYGRRRSPPKPSAQLQYLYILILVFSRTDYLLTDPIGARDSAICPHADSTKRLLPMATPLDYLRMQRASPLPGMCLTSSLTKLLLAYSFTKANQTFVCMPSLPSSSPWYEYGSTFPCI